MATGITACVDLSTEWPYISVPAAPAPSRNRWPE
jgi:hypothetical protein